MSLLAVCRYALSLSPYLAKLYAAASVPVLVYVNSPGFINLKSDICMPFIYKKKRL
jgi:hypothetical protein